MDGNGDYTSFGDNSRLSYIDVENIGPPVRPLDFPAPTVHNGRRRAMNVYDPKSERIVHVKNVLYRSIPPSSLASGRRPRPVSAGPPEPLTFRQQQREDLNPFPDRAYCIQKKVSDAIYGSVRLCTVLKRRKMKTMSDVGHHHLRRTGSTGQPPAAMTGSDQRPKHLHTSGGSISPTRQPRQRIGGTMDGFNVGGRGGGCGGVGSRGIPPCLPILEENPSRTSSAGHHNATNANVAPCPGGGVGGNTGEPPSYAVWEATNEKVAIKLISWSEIRNLRGRHLEDPLKEISCHQLLGNYHPNVLGSLEVLQDDKFLYSVMPYCEGGDLFGKIMEELHHPPLEIHDDDDGDASEEGGDGGGGVDEDRVRFWFEQILRGLQHLQKKGVCHRDLSLENIMVHGDKCLLMDFGMSLRVPHSDPINVGPCSVTDVSAGTPRRLMKAQGQGGKWLYMAPEIVACDDAFDGYAVDLWAAGVILYIMLVGLAPFQWAHDADSRFVKFANGGLIETLEEFGVPISREAADLLQGMLWRDPRRRLTLSQVLKHPWMRKRHFPTAYPATITVGGEEEEEEAAVGMVVHPPHALAVISESSSSTSTNHDTVNKHATTREVGRTNNGTGARNHGKNDLILRARTNIGAAFFGRKARDIP